MLCSLCEAFAAFWAMKADLSNTSCGYNSRLAGPLIRRTSAPYYPFINRPSIGS
jgi:hypothetical protein